MMPVYVGNQRVVPDPGRLLGVGGEAEVFLLPGGRALKLFKEPTHPDLHGSEPAQEAARLRLEEHQHKLLEFPGGLPAQVVAPTQLARRGQRVVGYCMRALSGATPLARWAQPRRRRFLETSFVLETLRQLRETLLQLHRAGVVVGDLNDNNVLVEPSGVPHLIDADSFQFGPYPCRVYTERCVDPQRCDPRAERPVLISAHDAQSDWYAFCVLAFSTLLAVAPFGGVHAPSQGPRKTIGQRLLRGPWVLSNEVNYPRAALSPKSLTPALRSYFEQVFCQGERGVFPRDLLAEPGSVPRAAKAQSVSAAGHLRAQVLFEVPNEARILDTSAGTELRVVFLQGKELRDERGGGWGTVEPRRLRWAGRIDQGVALVEGSTLLVRQRHCDERLAVDLVAGEPQVVVSSGTLVWVHQGVIYRFGRLGPEPLGRTVRGQTRLFAGASDGQVLGMYCAGGLRRCLRIDAQRKLVDDAIALPAGHGRALRDAWGLLDGDRCWLFLLESAGPRLQLTSVVFDGGHQVAQVSTPDLDSPLACSRGAVAAGNSLLLATEAGVLRLEAGQLSASASFPETAPFVDSSSLLALGRHGLLKISLKKIHLLKLERTST